MIGGKTVVAIVRTGPLWRVVAPDATHRTFDFRVDAEEAALKLADLVRAQGGDPEVLLQEKFGELRPLTFG